LGANVHPSFHSATTHDHFTAEGAAPTRLVELFFFDV
jgi:hypothetical protein